MKLQRIPSLILALLLQMVPLSRMALVNPAVAQSGFAILLRWTAGTGVLLGAVDAVSGASAAISGLQAYVGTTKLGGVTFTPAVPAGISNLTLRIIVSNPGSDHKQDYWNCTPLPPSLTINTNAGASGYITNIPGRLTVAGVYPVTLLAGNLNFGAITANATITVQASGGTAPAITTQPLSLTVTKGDNASFSVVASGSPSPTYQWRKGGVNLTGATSATFSLSGVTTNDAGNYDAVASNASGSATSVVATLTVLVPPSITTQPLSLTVTNGDPASFSVVATGFPSPTYQWRKGGVNLAGATSATFSLSGVTTNDAGNYDVVASNASGSATSVVATLTVQLPSIIPLALATVSLSNGVPTFDVTGPLNASYVVWCSADLRSWIPLQTNFTADGTWHYVDTQSPAGSVQFYQATLTP